MPRLQTGLGVNKGLVGYWPLGNKGTVKGNVALDLAGRQNNATLIGSPTISRGAFGGQALAFNGTSQAASVAIDLSPYSTITLSFWMYWNNFTNDDELAFEYTTASFSTNGALIVDPNESGTSSFVFGPRQGSTPWLDGFPRPSVGAWHHYALIMNRTVPANTAYVDGILQTLTANVHTMAGGTPFATSSLYFMSRAGTALFAGGRLRDVRITGRALGGAEVWKLYTAGATPGLVTPKRRRLGLASSVTTAFLSGMSRVLGNARSSPTTIATVAATARVETIARAASAAPTFLPARSSTLTASRGRLAATSTISARSLAEAAGRAANSASAPVSGRSNEMTGVRASTAPLAGLSGASKVSDFGRTQGAAAATITGRAETTVTLKGPTSPKAAFAGTSRAMVGGLANPIATTSIVAIAARVGATTAGRAQTSATAGIVAASRVTKRAKGALVAVVTIAARTGIAGASISRLTALAGIAAHSRAMTHAGATIASTVTMAFLSAVTRIAVSGRAAFWTYVPRRTVTLPPDARTTTLPPDARVKQLPGDR